MSGGGGRCRTLWTRGAVGDEYLSMEGVLVVLGCPGPGVGLPLVRVGNTTQRRDEDGAFVINYSGVGGRDTALFVYSSGSPVTCSSARTCFMWWCVSLMM